MLGTQMPMNNAALSNPTNQRTTDARSDKIAPALKRISPFVRFMNTMALVDLGTCEKLKVREVSQ